jgi:predicted nucleic acid-binding Zn ribbon protein
MARCTRCSAENAEDARYCIQCGASLQPSGVGAERQGMREKDSRFNRSRPVSFFWLLVGVAIVLWGLSDLLAIYLKIRLEVWPLIVIVLGLYLIYRALYRTRRRYAA